jgi:hypothetical protein
MRHLDIDVMSGVEFEAYVRGVLRYNGYLVGVTKVTGDFGVDLIARKGAEIVAVQCKRSTNPVGPAAVQQVVAGAVMYDCTSTMVVTNRSFARAAVALAERRNCVLIGGGELLQLAAGWLRETDTHGLVDDVGPVVSARRFNWKQTRPMVVERLSRSGQMAVECAQESASAMHAIRITAAHLLLGVLNSANSQLLSLLAGHGVNPDRVRERLAADEALLNDDDVAV